MTKQTLHELIHCGPVEDDFFIDTWEINGYTIAVQLTAVGEFSVISFPAGSRTFLRTNWLAGENEKEAIKLINVLIQVIDENQIEKAPYPSSPYVFYKADQTISSFIEPFTNVYVKKIALVGLVAVLAKLGKALKKIKTRNNEQNIN